MRHLVPCGGTKDWNKPIDRPAMRPPLPRRAGADHTVLLTVVGKPNQPPPEPTPDPVLNQQENVMNYPNQEAGGLLIIDIPAIPDNTPFVMNTFQPPPQGMMPPIEMKPPHPVQVPVQNQPGNVLMYPNQEPGGMSIFGAPPVPPENVPFVMNSFAHPPPGMPPMELKPSPVQNQPANLLMSYQEAPQMPFFAAPAIPCNTPFPVNRFPHPPPGMMPPVPQMPTPMQQYEGNTYNYSNQEYSGGLESITVINQIPDNVPVRMTAASFPSHGILRDIAVSGDYWHKFIIMRGAGYSKMEIMVSLFKIIHPHLIAPVMYRHEQNNVTFLARNCLYALMQLTNNHLQMKIDTTGPLEAASQIVDIEIILRHIPVDSLPIDLGDVLTKCAIRRHDKRSGILDMSAFHQDPELAKVVFWALWNPKAFRSVLNIFKNRIPTIRSLHLSHNELTELPPMRYFRSLKTLDLSSNKFTNMKFLSAFEGIDIIDVSIDNNPVCAKFQDENQYTQVIRRFFPYVKRIDGVTLTGNDIPVWRRHYIPPGETTCVALVDQFLQHYFTLLDGDDRQRLHGMYHPDALFSLTSNFVPGQNSSSTARLASYSLECRNLLRVTDVSKRQALLNKGSEEVLATLCRLPATEHDPHSFIVDLPYYTAETAVIVVSGVFREPVDKDNSLVRSFTRTFVLSKVATQEYQIVNEMLSVSNASTKQEQNSFIYPKRKFSLAKLSFNPAQDLNNDDRKQMTIIFSRLTQMKKEWSQKCLEESKWDIKSALSVFKDLLKRNKLPGDVFDPKADFGMKK